MRLSRAFERQLKNRRERLSHLQTRLLSLHPERNLKFA